MNTGSGHMGIFSRRRADVPDWSPFDDAKDHRAFTALVRSVFADAGVPVAGDDDQPIWRYRRLDGGEGQFGLENLAIGCANSPGEVWQDHVVRHVGALFAPDPTEALASDPDEVRASVRVRLLPLDTLRQHPGSPPHRPVTDDLVEVVVLDTPETVAILGADAYAPLELDDDQLFALGRDNLRTYEPLDLQPLDGADHELLVAESDSFFTATWALLLAEALELPDDGALVAMPSRTLLMVHPIRDLGVVRAIDVMLTIAHRAFAESAGNLTPDLHWFRDGALRCLPSSVVDGTVQFMPSEDLVQVLNRLSARETG